MDIRLGQPEDFVWGFLIAMSVTAGFILLCYIVVGLELLEEKFIAWKNSRKTKSKG